LRSNKKKQKKKCGSARWRRKRKGGTEIKEEKGQFHKKSIGRKGTPTEKITRGTAEGGVILYIEKKKKKGRELASRSGGHEQTKSEDTGEKGDKKRGIGKNPTENQASQMKNPSWQERVQGRKREASLKKKAKRERMM